jgi:membrane protein
MVSPGKGIGWKDFLVTLKHECERDRIDDVAGSVTFFAVLALFPFLLFCVSLAGTFVTPDEVDALFQQLPWVAPAPVTEILTHRMRSFAKAPKSGLLTFGAVGAVWAASGGVVSLIRALNGVYGVHESRPWWKVRLLAIATTLGAAVVVLIAAPLMVAAPTLVAHFSPSLGAVVGWLRFPVAGFLMMLLWACLFYVLPDVEQQFRFITPGSVVGVLLWLGASWVFSLYVSHFGNYGVIYGALGGVVVLLLWMWISAQVILLGEEINAVLEHRSPEGKAPGERRVDPSRRHATVTKTEVEQKIGPAHLPGGTQFNPDGKRAVAVGELGALSAAGWAAGIGTRRA